MIEGLKVTVKGSKLARLANAQADFHATRAKAYAAQIESMRNAKMGEADDALSLADKLESNSSYGMGQNPIQQLETRRKQHTQEEQELRFISENLIDTEDYQLERHDLVMLGVVR